MPVSFGIRRIFAEDVEGGEIAAFHRFEHVADVPAALGIEFAVPGFFEFRAQLIVFNMLKSREAIGNGTHVAAALDVVLSAERIYAAAVTADVSRQEREINQGPNVVDGVVMLGDAKGPAELGTRGFCIRVGSFANPFGGDAGIFFRAFERVRFDRCFVLLEMACRVFDELFIGEAGGDDFARHGVGEGNIGTNIEAEPDVSPLRRGSSARINDEKLGAATNALQQMMEKDRMRLASVRTPEQDYVRVFDFAVGTCAASRSENRRQTGDAGGVSSTVATVYVIGTDDGADEFLCRVVQLVGRF